MAHLSDLYIKADVLETLLKTVQAKGDKGIAITISTNDESNQYGQNVSSFVSQSKEDREASKPKFYVGNGKVFWTSSESNVFKPEREQQSNGYQEAVIVSNESDDLPF